MSTSPKQDQAAPPSSAAQDTSSNTIPDWPLRFTAHYFSAFSYSTYDCNVAYNGSPYIQDPDDVLQISSDSLGSKYPNNLSASRGPIPNFPPPAVVTWRSQDGTSHRAEIDMAEIFKDQLIRHDLAREDISRTSSISPPGIIVEVNDRTINVYMRAMIYLRKPRYPGRPHSTYQDDLIKVFSRTY